MMPRKDWGWKSMNSHDSGNDEEERMKNLKKVNEKIHDSNSKCVSGGVMLLQKKNNENLIADSDFNFLNVSATIENEESNIMGLHVETNT